MPTGRSALDRRPDRYGTRRKRPHSNQLIQPSLVEQVFVVRLTKTGANTGEQLVLKAVVEPFHRFAVDTARTAATFITHDFVTFDTNEWRHISQSPQFAGNFVRNKVAVGKGLEITSLDDGRRSPESQGA